ncbi:MAG TPA: NADP-dependent oxidoreductase [Puia sp.]|jgi:NADPH:quinone reductase-like Zn-dependent oxidoreductase|nr:NADP-dependent oxidoreductase [Puia sp.]
MKAIQIKKFGGPETLELVNIPKPDIKENEVLIRMKAAGVNPVDAKMRAGYLQKAIPVTLPKTLGWDASGIIETIGSRITRFKPGDEVYCATSFTAGGSYAEFMAAPENEVALKPKNISFAEAASLPIIAITAYSFLFEHANLQPGQKIAIVGAAGGVGAMAVQMAKHADAYVVGIGSGKDIDFILSLKSDEALDYRKPDYLDSIKDFDVVLDLVGGPSQNKLFPTVKKGGMLLSTVQPPDEEMAKAFGIHSMIAHAKGDYHILDKITEMVEAGQLKTRVGIILPLMQAVQAHQLLEKGSSGGKIILEIN